MISFVWRLLDIFWKMYRKWQFPNFQIYGFYDFFFASKARHLPKTLKILFFVLYSPVHMRWFTHGVYNIHICIICTRVYFWACERNCLYAKVNLHMCKYTPPCKYTPAQTRCIFAYTYMYFIHICIFGHVNAQQIYTRMQM